jgi:hypothetical protein
VPPRNITAAQSDNPDEEPTTKSNIVSPLKSPADVIDSLVWSGAGSPVGLTARVTSAAFIKPTINDNTNPVLNGLILIYSIKMDPGTLISEQTQLLSQSVEHAP